VIKPRRIRLAGHIALMKRREYVEGFGGETSMEGTVLRA
jgi:hypothetical protein